MIKGTIAIKDCQGAIWPINLNDIIAVKVDVYLCTVHLESGKEFVIVQSLKETLSILNDDSFVQIRRDTIINATKIEKFEDNKVYLKSGHKYDISFRKKKKIKGLFIKL